jgi:hypothetical protein
MKPRIPLLLFLSFVVHYNVLIKYAQQVLANQLGYYI